MGQLGWHILFLFVSPVIYAFIYLKRLIHFDLEGDFAERGGEKANKSSMCRFTPPVAATPGAELVQSWEAPVQSRSPVWVLGLKDLPILCWFPRPPTESWIWGGAPGIQTHVCMAHWHRTKEQQNGLLGHCFEPSHLFLELQLYCEDHDINEQGFYYMNHMYNEQSLIISDHKHWRYKWS